jgi:hypothetical protein
MRIQAIRGCNLASLEGEFAVDLDSGLRRLGPVRDHRAHGRGQIDPARCGVSRALCRNPAPARGPGPDPCG